MGIKTVLQVKIILKMCKLSNIIKMFGEKSASYVLLYYSLIPFFDNKSWQKTFINWLLI